MNILIITYLFDPEPIVMSTITKDLAIYLSTEHNVTVLTSKPCRPYGYDLKDAQLFDSSWPFKRVIMDTYTHPKSDLKGRMKENRSFGKGAVRYIEEHSGEIDAIYMNAFALFSQKMIIKCAKKYKIRVVNHIEDVYPEPFRERIPYVGSLIYKVLLPIDKWNVTHADCSIVIGRKIKEYYVKTRSVSPEKIEVVYNWQDESRFRNITAQPHHIKTFAYVGSVSKSAGLGNIIQAFGECAFGNARLIIAGSGTEKEALQEMARPYGSNIIFTSASSGEVANIQASADVLILPLRKYVALRAVPSKLAAYLFSKRPVLALVEKESDVAYIMETAKCGWVVPPEETDALKRMFKSVVEENTQELDEMGERGYKYSQEHLTKEVNLPALAKIVTG